MITLQPSPIAQLDEYNIIDVVGEIPRRIRRDDGADADVLAEGINSCCLFSVILI